MNQIDIQIWWQNLKLKFPEKKQENLNNAFDLIKEKSTNLNLNGNISKTI